MCISSAIQDKIDPASWIARKQGWAGWVNPAAELDRAIERKTPGINQLGIVKRKTETEKLEHSINRSSARATELQPRFSGAPAHAMNIARANAPPPTIGIAGRRAG